jgi:hypothetical protein
MKFIVIIKKCNVFSGSNTEREVFNNLQEGWKHYKKTKKFDFEYAGNDYHETTYRVVLDDTVIIKNRPHSRSAKEWESLKKRKFLKTSIFDIDLEDILI